ncbi:YetF domain-containing protein [Arthrobacter sp.]|uniref:YetF domain-containing protein n=1 Tax=Arthrobacter sp. TaxID=1667 RepID=UPI003A8FE8BC
MWHQYGLTWADAGRVVASAVVLYVLVLALIRVMGQRTMASLSSFDLAAAVALGAVVGRAILGYTPTLASGALGLLTLLVLQALTGQLRRFRAAAGLVSNPPYLLMAGSHAIDENLRRTHISGPELTARLRLAGVRQRAEVACVILESTGQISVLRAGVPIEPDLLEGVVGAEQVPSSYMQQPPQP